MTAVFLNDIATAVPAFDIHDAFAGYVSSRLAEKSVVFDRMAARSGIAHRYSVLPAGRDGELDGQGFYRTGAFPSTQRRMKLYRHAAFPLAKTALDGFAERQHLAEVTHLILVSCTGFVAPGLDSEILSAYGLDPAIERTVIGFMGCFAAITALKQARHIVRSNPAARVLIVSLELCTLHLQESSEVDELLSYLLFADGCAAALVSAQPTGLELGEARAMLIPDGREQITWTIGDRGFLMYLSGLVPRSIRTHVPAIIQAIGGVGAIRHWAVHPGGRSVLDAVEECVHLPPSALATSRAILRDYGNMSSATVLFVLQKMLAQRVQGDGIAMAFGPGLSIETIRFRGHGND